MPLLDPWGTNLIDLPGTSDPFNVSHSLLEQWVQKIHIWHFANLKDYTFSNIPESSLSKMYYLLHPHLNFNTYQFISRNNSRESRDGIYHAVLFTTGQKTEKHSYSTSPVLSLSRYHSSLGGYLHSLLFPSFWSHVQVKLLINSMNTVLLRVPVKPFGYFRDQFCVFLVLFYVLPVLPDSKHFEKKLPFPECICLAQSGWWVLDSPANTNTHCSHSLLCDAEFASPSPRWHWALRVLTWELAPSQ